MTDEIAVVKPYYRREEAYRKGYEAFSDTDLPDEAEPDIDGLRESARYANHVLPDLRAMAGHADRGHGTYNENRQVAAIKPGCEEDEPAAARLTEATRVFGSLLRAWERGAYDALADLDADPGRHE
jgi:hypothetical protein